MEEGKGSFVEPQEAQQREEWEPGLGQALAEWVVSGEGQAGSGWGGPRHSPPWTACGQHPLDSPEQGAHLIGLMVF